MNNKKQYKNNDNESLRKTGIYKDIMQDFIDDEDGLFDEDAYIDYLDKASIHFRWDNQTVRFHGKHKYIEQGKEVNPITEHYFNSNDDEKSAIVKATCKSKNALGLSIDEITAIHADHYLNVDDDEYSPMGAAILKDRIGFSIDEIFDDDDEE